MADIFSAVVELDKRATERIEQAREEAAGIITAAKETEEKIISSGRRKMLRRESGEKVRENRKMAERLEQIEQDRLAQIAAIEQEFSDNRDKWAEELFVKVIS